MGHAAAQWDNQWCDGTCSGRTGHTVVGWDTVTGTRDWLACMPVDRGKSWEPAHIFLISSCLILSHLNLISSLVFTTVSLIRVAAPCTLVPPSRLVSCYRSMFLLLLSPSITTCTYYSSL